MRARLSVVAAILAGSACNPAPPAGLCTVPANPGDAGPEVITAIGVAPAGEPFAPDGDGGAIVPLVITATVPCLSGGLDVDVSSSIGSLDGLRPGVQEAVPLSPAGVAGSGELQGSVTLDLALAATARVSVTLDDASFFADVAASLDGGVVVVPGTFAP